MSTNDRWRSSAFLFNDVGSLPAIAAIEVYGESKATDFLRIVEITDVLEVRRADFRTRVGVIGTESGV